MKLKVGDVLWDYCDIDGHGKKWRIAVIRREWEGELMIHYPLDDFSDYADDRHELRSVKIEPPAEPKDAA
jgi:hypothetical protein